MGESLRDIARGFSNSRCPSCHSAIGHLPYCPIEMTSAQVLMHHEMEMANMVKAAQAVPVTAAPEVLGDVLSSTLGSIVDKEAHEEALAIIRENYSPDIILSIPQWVYVTRMIELGVIAGRAGS